ncbi:MAG: transcriptional regulator [Desulfovibrio sp.]|jgi:predicted transcriptional regulator YheO
MRECTKAIFDNAKRTAHMIVQSFGNSCEVVIHDFADLEHSVVHVEGNVTNRAIGAPVTDLVVKTLRSTTNGLLEDLINYETTTSEGRMLKSSTCFLRTDTGEVVGALCVNFDVTDFANSIALMENLVQFGDRDKHRPETFAASLVETNDALMEQAIREVGKTPSLMNKEERIRCVSILEENGAFLIKGAVEYVAQYMGVSKYTIYNYLKLIRSHQG